MSAKKKQVRANFRNSCFKRDKYACVLCGFQSSVKKAEQELDAHHITDRNEMPNGGYVPENGISLCEDCHILAEEYHISGGTKYTYHPDQLYAKIGSCKDKAIRASEKL